MEPVRFCVVISTLGTRPELRRLLQSLEAQSVAPLSVGIADQGTSDLVERLLREFERRLPLFVVRTGRRGLSAGRNDVIAAAPDGTTHFTFPNDTSFYGETFLADLAKRIGRADVAAVSYIDSDGVRNRLPRSGIRELTRQEVFSLIEPGTVVRAERLRDVGGFDEMVGTGSPSLRQSGEGTDLLLRMMTCAPVRVAWLPELAIRGVPQSFGLSHEAERKKARGYGYGYGYLLQRWHFPLGKRVRALIGPVLLAATRRLRWEVGFATSLGRFEGMRAAHGDGVRIS